MKDFFISYTGTDKKWAEWIAWQLEKAKFSTVIQAWDFRPGQNFVLEMHKAAKDTYRTIAVLSQSWLNALYTQPEWAAAFTQDPTGEKQKLILIRIDKCKPEGLLSAIIYIDLVELSEESATKTLLDGIKRERMKPETRPSFPVNHHQPVGLNKPRFPGALPLVWNISSPRNLNFTGREDILNDLRKSLTSEKSATLNQAIHGLGGVGKTQLALEYAYRYACEYDKVWWIHAEEPTTLAADYVLLASAIGLPVKDITEQGVIIREVKQWLGQNGNWLLIFDNAQRPEDIRFYMPQGKTGHVLITSRNQAWSGLAASLRVNVMEPSESVEFLCRRTGEEDKETAKLLAEELGHLPLALEQAGACIESAKKSLNDYLKLYREYRQRILERGKPFTDYPATVATTWEISFQKARELSSATVDLLNICAFLSPDEIPRELLFEGIKGTSEPLVASLTDPLIFDEAISILNTYSLIEARIDAIMVHRLVQAVTRDRLKKVEQETWFLAAVKIINNIFPFESYDVRYWKECAVLLPHAQVLISHFDKYITINIDEFRRLLNQVGMYLHSKAEYSNAAPLYRRVLEITEKQLGQDHPDVATCMNNLATLFQNQGKNLEAEPLFRRTLEIRERQLVPEHPDIASSLNNLAGLLKDQGRYAEAEPLFCRALGICEKQLGQDHPHVATCLNNLAELLRNQGKYAEAESLCRRALEIRKKQLGEDYPDVAVSLNNLAVLLQDQGKYAEAEPLLRRALGIREKQLGQDHPDVANSLNNLACLFKVQGKYAEAEQLHRSTLGIWEKQLGQDHHHVAMSLNNLAELLRVQGKYEEAEPLFHSVLGINEKQLGYDHPDVANSVNNLALLLQSQGKYTEAEQLLLRSLNICERTLGREHPNTKTVRENLNYLRKKMR